MIKKKPTLESLDKAYNRRKFDNLVSWWIRENSHHSVPEPTYSHVAYQRIVEMGKPAIPFIFYSMLVDGNSCWYEAMKRITRTEPVPVERPELLSADSSYDGIREFWRKWGKDRGYLGLFD